MRIHFHKLSFLWILLLATPLAASTTKIWVLNIEGNTIDVIDTKTNKIVQSIPNIPKPHGVAFSPDGKLAYLSSEAEDQENSLYLLDTKTGKILKKTPLTSRRGNVPAISKDGKRLIVCIGPPRDDRGGVMNAGGALDIVDTASLTVIKTIHTPQGGHDCYTSADGKYWVAGSGVGGATSAVYVIDLQTGETLWTIPYKEGVAPIGLEAGPDGSPRRLFVTPLLQFKKREVAIVDFATHQEVSRIELPDQPSGFRVAPPLARRNNGIPVHGLDISPDGKTLAISSRAANALFFYSLPDVKFLGFVPAPTVEGAEFPNNGSDPSWVTFTPDSKTLYMSCSAGDVVAVIDVKTMKEVTRIKVGRQPDHVYPLVSR
jgi:YVTN family beta-propeller protein